MAVNIESTVPRPSVMAKPRIVPVPRKNRTAAAMIVVMFESKIVVRFWIVQLLLAAVTLVTLKIR